MEKKQKAVNGLRVVVAFLFAMFGCLPTLAQAATLFFSPSSGTYDVGSSFTTNVYVSSADQAMNAASGVVTFPADKVAVESISKGGSIFSLWVLEPSFSNAAGTVNFEGIVLNPGYTGKSAKILSIRFKAKAVGTVPVAFSTGLVLANDGKGTNILTGLGKANFTIGPVKPGEPAKVPPPVTVGTPAAPDISSPTHPDAHAWYAQNDPKFTWTVPKGVTGARLSIDGSPNATPTEAFTTPIDSKEYTDVADGVWYFSAQLRNAKGWGDISRYVFQIDTTQPTRLELNEVEKEDVAASYAIFDIRADDEASGIARYDIQIDDGSPLAWEDDGSHRYQTPELMPGTYSLLVRAVDKAGNVLEKSAEFVIRPLEAPVFTDYPKEPRCEEVLVMKGTTRYPGAEVSVSLQHEDGDVKSSSVKSDADGRFTYVADDRLACGTYTAWAEVTDSRGAQSGVGEKVAMTAVRPVFLMLGSWAIGFLTVFISLLLLALLLMYLSWRSWRKLAILRKESEQAMSDIIRSNHEIIKEEERIIQQLKKELEDAKRTDTKSMDTNIPRVGIGVMILREGKVLLAKRKGSHGEGEYAFPGGHLENMESFEACARREIAEECGIEIGNVRFQVLANIMAYAPKHYVHIGLVADWVSGEPRVLEPEKSESWAWYPIDALPSPLFVPCRIAVEAFRDGTTYHDVG